MISLKWNLSRKIVNRLKIRYSCFQFARYFDNFNILFDFQLSFSGKRNVFIWRSNGCHLDRVCNHGHFLHVPRFQWEGWAGRESLGRQSHPRRKWKRGHTSIFYYHLVIEPAGYHALNPASFMFRVFQYLENWNFLALTYSYELNSIENMLI